MSGDSIGSHLDVDHDASLPSTTEVLAEHLYEKVGEICPQNTSKITGVLLERGDSEVLKMLQNTDYLRQCIAFTYTVFSNTELQNSISDNFQVLDPTTSELLIMEGTKMYGDTVYEKVAGTEPALCAEITGMLLELDSDLLLKLLESETDFVLAVGKAKAAFLQSVQQKTRQEECDEVNNNDEADTEEMGERIFDKVEKVFPDEAAQITGMLLEMKHSQLEQVLGNPDDLKASIEYAHKVLHAAKN